MIGASGTGPEEPYKRGECDAQEELQGIEVVIKALDEARVVECQKLAVERGVPYCTLTRLVCPYTR